MFLTIGYTLYKMFAHTVFSHQVIISLLTLNQLNCIYMERKEFVSGLSLKCQATTERAQLGDHKMIHDMD